MNLTYVNNTIMITKDQLLAQYECYETAQNKAMTSSDPQEMLSASEEATKHFKTYSEMYNQWQSQSIGGETSPTLEAPEKV
jgi:hypothetical protein